MHVQRFIVRAYPTKDHPEYFSWQAATIVLFVGEDDKERAQRTALEELAKRNWAPEKFIARDTLIEERVHHEGGKVWEAYQQAQAGEIFWRESLEAIPFSTKQNPARLTTPRLSEQFIDRVIENAGGRRLTTEEAAGFREKNADYLLDNYVIELKDLQEEGLEVTTRQEKIAELFAEYPTAGYVQKLDPFRLSETDFDRYCDIVGAPIQKRIHAASKQIRATTERLKPKCYRGTVIILNTGYSTVPHTFLEQLAARYAAKESESIAQVVTVSSWTMTDGFNSEVHFAFSPHESEDKSIDKLKQAFWSAIDALMSEWGRRGFTAAPYDQRPMMPVSFTHEGQVFTFGVPQTAEHDRPATEADESKDS